MRTTGLMAVAGVLSGRIVQLKEARRTPPREVRLARAGAAPVAEGLEARRLLSYSFSGGVLTFTGTNNADTIIAYRISNGSGDNVYVRRNDVTPEIAGPYSSSSVTKVVINGGLGNDDVSAELTGGFNYGNANFVEAMEINGDNGDDTLKGGDGADLIEGEADDDDIWGFGGDDALHGGYAGDDTADSAGDDTLRGGNGSDQMYGGPGDDWFDSFDGVRGNDYSNGGSGNDSRLDWDDDDTFDL